MSFKGALNTERPLLTFCPLLWYTFKSNTNSRSSNIDKMSRYFRLIKKSELEKQVEIFAAMPCPCLRRIYLMFAIERRTEENKQQKP